MSTITAITPQQKDKERYNIFIDNAFYCGLQLETIIKYKIKVGDEVDLDVLANIQLDSEKSKALDKAFDYISKTIKSTKQVSQYLLGKGYKGAVISFVLEKLAEYKFVDDTEYAKCYINTYKNKKGKKLIEYELKNKGINKHDIDNAFSTFEFDESVIKSLAEKFMKNREYDNANINKLYRHLSSKGFNYDEIQSVIDYYKKED